MVVTNGLKAPRARLQLERLEERCLLTGAITEFPILTAGSGPFGIVTGPDGNLWFTQQTSNQIARMTTKGVVTEFNVLTAASKPTGIVVGPDGNLWFTEMSGNKIARITTKGVITEFVVPTAASDPYGITNGPDGNLWFTEQSGNKVSRITTNGLFMEFPVTTAASEPTEIVTGPDKNLWFTEMGSDKIGRMTTSGVVTEFAVPTAASVPFGIAVGSDGNLWFTEMTGNKIARITTLGVVTEFALPFASSEPYGITNGPDGNLWFTELTGNKIGQITTKGIITEFTILTAGSQPAGITPGPDGNIWFTELMGNKIGQVAITSTTTSPPPPPSGGSGGGPTSPPPPPPLPVSHFPTADNGTQIGVQLAAVDATGTVTLDNNRDGVFDTGDSTFTFGFSSDTYVVGDWNGSGFDSVGVVRGSPSGVAVWSIDTNEDEVFDNGDAVYFYGLNTDKFVAGDWTGSGTTKIGVVQALPDGSAQWTLNTNGSGVFSASDAVFNFGLGSDTPITGDWNGAGKSEIGIVRSTPSGVLQWVLDTNGDGVFDAGDSVFNFGLNGDTPVVGDWTGLGTDKIGIARPQSNGTAIWALDNNGDGIYDPALGDGVFAFGQASVDFLAGKWKPTQALFSGDGVLNAPVAALKPDANFTATINQAIAAWAQAGITPQQVTRLENANYSIGTLNGGLLGETSGNNVVIDGTAQGNGWSESAAPQPGRMDLFTALEHEMGHVLGLPDQSTQANDVMYESLLPGVRKTPTTQDVDALFAAFQ